MELKTIKIFVLNLLFFPLLIFCQQPVNSEFHLQPDSLRYLKLSVYSSNNPKASRMDVYVDSVVKTFMLSPQNCGLSIGISYNGKSTYYNYGETKRTSGALPDQNTIYELGSLTASFCGFLLAKAVAENKISLDDDVRKYLPEKFSTLSYNKKPICIKHLANHSSGLPQLPDDLILQENYDAKNPYKNYSKEQLFAYLERVKLITEPGTVSDYSSMGIALLGLVIEQIYGNSFAALVKEKIAKPLGMTNTSIELSTQQVMHFAEGYTEDGTWTPHWNLNAFEAAGGLRSSSSDMLLYLDFNLLEIQTKDKKENLAASWFIKKTKQDNTLFYQSGGTFGSGGFSGFIKEKKCSVIVLANSGRNVDYIAIALLNYLQQ